MISGSSVWMQIVFFAIIGFIAWEILRPKWSVRIEANRDGIQSHRGIAKGQQQRLSRFLQQDLALDGKVTILARRDRNGHLRVRCRGKLDPGMQQQIRNFLIALL